MTQRRNDPGCITNYFDRVLAGVGHRGSSFIDIDRVDWAPLVFTQDDGTGRVLVQEFKHEEEPTNMGQLRALIGLVRISPAITVWMVTKYGDGHIGWRDLREWLTYVRARPGVTDYASAWTTGPGAVMETITAVEYRTRFHAWWNNQSIQRSA
jgi:hypothetical protein